jgi:hypothetical protein
VETPIWVEVGLHCDELFLERNGTDQVQEERLAGTVFADDETEGRASVRDAIDVRHERTDLLDATDLDQMLSLAWHHSGTKRLQN